MCGAEHTLRSRVVDECRASMGRRSVALRAVLVLSGGRKFEQTARLGALSTRLAVRAWVTQSDKEKYVIATAWRPSRAEDRTERVAASFVFGT
jgi:hypothetical protein